MTTNRVEGESGSRSETRVEVGTTSTVPDVDEVTSRHWTDLFVSGSTGLTPSFISRHPLLKLFTLLHLPRRDTPKKLLKDVLTLSRSTRTLRHRSSLCVKSLYGGRVADNGRTREGGHTQERVRDGEKRKRE